MSAAPAWAPRSRRSACWAWRSSSSVIRCRSAASAVRLASVSVRAQGPERGSATWSESAWRWRRSWTRPGVPGVVECRCHTGNSGIGHRQSRAWNGVFRAAVEKYFESFWSPRGGGAAPPLQRTERLCGPSRRTESLVGWFASSTIAMRHPGADRDPRRTSPCCCAFRPDADPQPRGGLDTRSLALAARPPEGATERTSHPLAALSLLDHREGGVIDTRSLALAAATASTRSLASPRRWRLSTRCRPAAARRSRHPLAGARCSTTGGWRLLNLMPTRSREEVSTPARWRSLLDHRRLARLLNHHPAAPLGPAPSPQVGGPRRRDHVLQQQRRPVGAGERDAPVGVLVGGPGLVLGAPVAHRVGQRDTAQPGRRAREVGCSAWTVCSTSASSGSRPRERTSQATTPARRRRPPAPRPPAA